MLTVAEAQRRLLEGVVPLPAAATPLANAAGLVLAVGVVAARELPGFDNSAMDGFAVMADDLHTATAETPVRLRLAGEVRAGEVYPGTLERGSAIRINTGAPIPAGADAVLEVEETEVDGDSVLARRAVDRGRSFRRAGTDIAYGHQALASGTYLGPAQVGLLAALGVTHPSCVPRPRIGLITTGDELVDPSVSPEPGEVADVGTPALSAAVAGIGATPVLFPRIPDDRARLLTALRDAATEADVVLSVGGVSMGEYDLVRGAVERLGQLDFWKVAARPGKPIAVGEILGRRFIGLPGNPVSALVGFEVYVLPLVMALSGRPGWHRPRIRVRLAEALETPEGLRTFARARLEARPGDIPHAWPASGQASYQMHSLANSNALLDIPESGAALAAGDTVHAILVDLPPGPPL
jgi:molybdopterin molybdotransferase